ncbi:hypothetical protein Q8P09_12230 [Psychrobacter faecalis]|uniref:EF-hand domain-containing protein n=1 Tax=Psychrobacter faecalis TaxID=180588 RepID=A0ABT9HJ85_9GAMM|nr:hypothetical protein [Psychrobacter faecalis]MDP4545842.1 hypothetical protein [Psychrobacter faecalis]
MSKIMIYAPLSAIGGTIENVWGTEMRVKSIDSSDKDAVEQAKADGWSNKAQDVIDQVEAEKLQAENKVMKGQLAGSNPPNSRTKELEEQLSQALTEIAGLEETVTELTDKVEVYEKAKDKNGNGKIDYEEMTNTELQKLLDQRKVEYNKRDGKDALIKAAKDSE